MPAAALGAAVGRLRGVHRYHWTRNQMVLSRLEAALGRLERDGILPVMVSGPAVTSRWYPDAGGRPVQVVDLLLDAASIALAVARLRELDWADADWTVARGLRWAGTRALAAEPGCRLQLHPAAPAETGGAVALTLGAIDTRALDAEGSLLAMCGGAWRFREWSTPLWIPDAALLVQSAGATLDWARVAAGATAEGTSMTVRARLEDLRAAGLAPVPDAALDRLAGVRPTALERVEGMLARRISPSASDQLEVRRRSWLRATTYAWDRALVALRGAEAASAPRPDRSAGATGPAARQ